MDLKFDELHPCYVMDIGGKHVLFTHYPLTDIPHSAINVHGHIHNNISPNPRHINVSVEHTGYKPIDLKLMLQTREYK